jgi:MFS family permease
VAGKLLEAGGWAAFWPAIEAWVAEEFGSEAGTAMGVGYGAYAAAFVIGTSAAGFVIEAAGFRVPFLVYLGTAGAALGLILAMPGAHGASGRPAREGAAVARAASTQDAQARRRRLLAYGTGFVYVFGLGAVLAFLPAYAADRGLTPRAVGLLLGTYWVARLVASVTAGRLSDRIGRRAVLLPAMLCSAAAATLVAVPADPWLLFLGAAGLGVTAGACAPTCIGLIADHVRAADRGAAMGLFEGACGASMILAGFAGGHAAESFGPAAPYVLTAVLAGGWAFVLARSLPLTAGRAG